MTFPSLASLLGRLGVLVSVQVLYSAVWSFFFSSRRRHTRFDCDWSSDVCSSDLRRQCSDPGRWALGPVAPAGRSVRVTVHSALRSPTGPRATPPGPRRGPPRGSLDRKSVV